MLCGFTVVAICTAVTMVTWSSVSHNCSHISTLHMPGIKKSDQLVAGHILVPIHSISRPIFRGSFAREEFTVFKIIACTTYLN